MSDIEALGVNTQEPFHSENQIGLRRLDDQMKMIAHEAVRMNLPLSFATGFTERGKKLLTVGIILENVFLTVAAVDDMVNRAGILNAQSSGHA